MILCFHSEHVHALSARLVGTPWRAGRQRWAKIRKFGKIDD
jgi:hypothetical protein